MKFELKRVHSIIWIFFIFMSSLQFYSKLDTQLILFSYSDAHVISGWKIFELVYYFFITVICVYFFTLVAFGKIYLKVDNNEVCVYPKLFRKAISLTDIDKAYITKKGSLRSLCIETSKKKHYYYNIYSKDLIYINTVLNKSLEEENQAN